MKYKVNLKYYYAMAAIMLVGIIFSSAHAATATYTYDNLNRLTRVSYDNGTSINYTYDAAGNITRVDKVGHSATVDAPTVMTQAADNIASGTVTLHGLVNANNAEAVVSFQYGTTTAYGSSVDAEPGLVDGSSDTSVSASISDMVPSTTYHFRIVASNSEGTSYGEDRNFTTLAINNEDRYVILTGDASYTIEQGSNTAIYGSSGENNICIESGAAARIFNFPGSNTITIESASNLFTVSRSGATVTFAGSDGTFVEMPASSPPQRISFNDIELELSIKNNQVMLENQVVDLTPSAIEFEIYDPSNPIIIGTVDTPGYAHAVTIIGQTAYVADGDSGLQVIDVSDPSNPIIIGAVDTPGSASAVTLMDQIAYVADWDKGLQVIDVSDPSNPVIVGSIDIPRYVDSVAINGDMTYVGGKWDSDLRMIDVSNPSNPVIVSSVDVSGEVHGITVNDNMVYVANSYYFRGLEIIDINNPVDPFIVGSIETPGLAYDVSVNGNIAYVADAHYGLQVIDVTNPDNPLIIGNIDNQFATSVVVAGDIAYMVSPESSYDDRPSCLKIIDVSDPSNPLEINSIDTDGYSVDVAIDGNKAYVTDGDYGLTIISVP